MKIDKTQQLAGYPILTIRDMLVTLDMYPAAVANRLKVSTDEARRVLGELIELGYIAELPDGERWCYFLPAGKALSRARVVPPLRRKKADKILQELLDRVQHVNNSPDFMYRVSVVLVFGSYLRAEVETLNDVNVAVELYPKILDPATWELARQMQVEESMSEGRYPSYLHHACFPHQKTWNFLNARSRYLRLVSLTDICLQGSETKQVFPA